MNPGASFHRRLGKTESIMHSGRPEQPSLLPEKSCDSDFDLPGLAPGFFFLARQLGAGLARHECAGKQPKSSIGARGFKSYIDFTVLEEPARNAASRTAQT